ncbi:MAG: aminotransferase class V-fold PLP-dependent enzyme [Myxococcota bacterium]
MERYRAEFPVTRRYNYLNHAGMCPVPDRVVQRITAAAQAQAEHGLVRIEAWEREVEEVRAGAARLVGCGADELTFVRNTSHGLSLVAAGIDWREGDVVLCATSEEYPSNVYPWQRLAARGVELRTVDAPGGVVSAEAFAAAGDARTRLVVVSSVQYASGHRVDLEALGAVCRKRGWWLCVDAIQSLGAIPFDAQAVGAHFVAADAHKWMLGPSGIGVLSVSRDVPLDPVLVGWRSTKEATNFDQVKLDLRDDAARFEEGSLAYVTIAGLGGALELSEEVGVPAIWDRVRWLGDHLIGALGSAGHRVTSPVSGAGRSASVVFEPAGGDPAGLVARLAERGIVVSCRRGRLRASPHFYNTTGELDQLVQALR